MIPTKKLIKKFNIVPINTAATKNNRLKDSANPPLVIKYTIIIVGTRFTKTDTNVFPENTNKLYVVYPIGRNKSITIFPDCTLRHICHVTYISIVENNADANTR